MEKMPEVTYGFDIDFKTKNVSLSLESDKAKMTVDLDRDQLVAMAKDCLEYAEKAR